MMLSFFLKSGAIDLLYLEHKKGVSPFFYYVLFPIKSVTSTSFFSAAVSKKENPTLKRAVAYKGLETSFA